MERHLERCLANVRFLSGYRRESISRRGNRSLDLSRPVRRPQKRRYVVRIGVGRVRELGLVERELPVLVERQADIRQILYRAATAAIA